MSPFAVVIGLYFLQALLTPYLPSEYQWYFYDIVGYVILLLISLGAFRHISYRKRVDKFLSFVIMVTSTWFLIQYIATTNVQNMSIRPVTQLIILLVSIVIFTPILINLIKSSYRLNRLRFSKEHCYIAHRIPCNFQGLIVSIFTAPYGDCSLIIKGRRFQFKHGRVVEIEHMNNHRFFYKRINDVPIQEARRLLGMRWSLRKNCFTVFYKFKGYSDGS